MKTKSNFTNKFKTCLVCFVMWSIGSIRMERKLAKYEDIALLNVQTKHVFKILLKFCDVLTYFCTYVIPIL